MVINEFALAQKSQPHRCTTIMINLYLVESVVRLPQPHHVLCRVRSPPGRIHVEEAEEERLAGRVVERGHVIADDAEDVKGLQ